MGVHGAGYKGMKRGGEEVLCALRDQLKKSRCEEEIQRICFSPTLRPVTGFMETHV